MKTPRLTRHFSLLLAAIVALLPASASADEVPARTMNGWLNSEEEGQRNLATAILHAAAHGATAANAFLLVLHQKELFCPPGKLPVTPDQNKAIFQEFVKTHPNFADINYEVVMVFAYRETFPCK